MAASKVELVFTGDDSKAMASAARLLDSARALGDAHDAAGKKQKSALDSVLPSLQGMLGLSFSIGGAVKLVNDYFEQMRAKAQAVREEMERVGSRTSSYAEAFGRLMMNMPGASRGELQQADQLIRQLAGNRAIGAGGMTRLADAFAMVQSSIPTASMGAKFDVMREVAQGLELEPTADASGIGLGIAKVMEGSRFSLSANQAQNLIRQQQMLGMVTQVGGVSRMIPGLSVAAGESGMDMPGMMGMAAWATQMLGDTEGNETTTILGGLAQKLVKNEADIEKLVRGLDLSGSLEDRMRQLGAARAEGRISDAQLIDVFPKMGVRGVSGMTLLSAAMDPGRAAMLDDFMGRMRAPGVLQGDMMADSIAAKAGLLGFGQDMASRRAAGAIEARSVERTPLAQLQFETDRLRNQLKERMFSAGAIDYAVNMYTSERVFRRNEGNLIGRESGGTSAARAREIALEEAGRPGWQRRLLGMGVQAEQMGAQALESLRNGTGTVNGRELRDAVREGVIEGMRARDSETGVPPANLDAAVGE